MRIFNASDRYNWRSQVESIKTSYGEGEGVTVGVGVSSGVVVVPGVSSGVVVVPGVSSGVVVVPGVSAGVVGLVAGVSAGLVVSVVPVPPVPPVPVGSQAPISRDSPKTGARKTSFLPNLLLIFSS
ncbi:hypothetical protein [Chroococcidiopsis sp. CCALA 051]|uniref:hypothetical protein n=1 Tax=Chroococcidiopsis sp. CCALA 051 TaxID=869949 RepID=UPI0011B1E0AF|nr:hypothetical protein [Chroococcidiopsis sp. CCALA 051]